MKNNSLNIFEYLEKSVLNNSKLIFKEKKEKFKLDSIFKIVEEFMINKNLPKEKQFYDYDYNSPDYDFFSPNAIEDVKELALIFKKKKYKNILAKSAVHVGTFKLYVNYIQIADITQINNELYEKLLKNTIVRESIHYAPLHFLRMNLFLELSRPRGDISRWEKVMLRLVILNESFPFTITNCVENLNYNHQNNKNIDHFNFLKELLIEKMNNDIIFIGEYAINQYNIYFPSKFKEIISKKNKKPTFLLLSHDSKKNSQEIYEKIVNKFENEDTKIVLKKIKNVDDFLPKYYSIYINNVNYVTIFQTEGCQNFNTIKRNNNEIKIGTLDTMLYYYFMFFYLDIDEVFIQHLHCYCFILFYLQENYKINNNKLLQRFNLSCIGEQKTIEDMIDIKNKKYQTLKNKRSSDEYKKYFLKYIPRKNKKTKKKKN